MSKNTQDRPIEEYSLLDHELQSDPYEFYERLHHECPVYRMPDTGMFLVTRYDDVREVLLDTATYSNDTTRAGGLGRPGSTSLQGGGLDALYHEIIGEKGWSHIPTLQSTDAPAHSRYRRLVDRVFTAKRVRELAPYIRGVADELIDKFIDAGKCEFMSDFAMPMPGIIIAEQLGLGRENIKTFQKWADAMLAPITKVMNEEEIRATAEIELEAQYFLAEVFEDRRANPQDDLISGLVHSHNEDEEPLNMHELQNLMYQLITGGFHTTQSAIAHGMWLLVRQPELQEELFREPGKVSAFIEESLRWESPVQRLARYTTRDTELSGTKIPAGSVVLVNFGAANRDETKFACPHQFDLDRHKPGAHLAFGSGVHFCVGAMLAREDFGAALTAIVNRMRDIGLAQDLGMPVHSQSLFFLEIPEMHLSFTKR